jgi:dTDP-glucose 4,6-dehydratase
MDAMMDSVLITGASGFLGGHLAAERFAMTPTRPMVLLDAKPVIRADHPVLPLLNKSSVRFVQADVRDGPLLAQLLREYRVSQVIHVASHAQAGDDPSELLDGNVASTLVLLEACRIAWLQSDITTRHRFHYVSCADILQANVNGTVFDSSPIAPETLYGASKAAAEAFVSGYAHRHRINATISYPTQIYGQGQNSIRMIPTLIQSLLDGKRVPLYGDGSLAVDLLHVTDAVKAISSVADKGTAGNRYGIAGSRASMAEIIATLCRAIDNYASNPEFVLRFPKSPAAVGKSTSTLITSVQDRRTYLRPRSYLFNALATVWPNPERKSITDGLLETVDWMVKNPAMLENTKTDWARRTA